MEGVRCRNRLPRRDQALLLLGAIYADAETLWARYTETTVEVFHRDNRVATHPRIPPYGRKHSTLPEHMPSSHRRFADWTLERIKREAGAIGPSTSALVD